MRRGSRVDRAVNNMTSWCSRNRTSRHEDIRVAIRMGIASRCAGAEADLPGYLGVRSGPGVVVDARRRGVVALRAFDQGAVVIIGTGVVREASEGGYDDKYAYAMDAAGPEYVGLDFDMGTERCNLVKYVNSAHGTSEDPNCSIRFYGAQLVVVAERRIEVNEELLVDYWYPDDGR